MMLFDDDESGLRAWFKANEIDASVVLEMHPLDDELTAWLFFVSIRDEDGLATVHDGALALDVTYRITTPGRPEWFDTCMAQLCWYHEEEERP
jgi:hypothetical protein